MHSLSFAARLFNLLEGKWEISRNVINIGRLNGSAQFEKSNSNPNELNYTEVGIFEFYENANTFSASRKYIYRLVNDCDISVYFDDQANREQRLFHKFDLIYANKPASSDTDLVKISALHLCSEDIYKVNYEFKMNADRMDEFNITYDVKGPNKNYISQTLFKRNLN